MVFYATTIPRAVNGSSDYLNNNGVIIVLKIDNSSLTTTA